MSRGMPLHIYSYSASQFTVPVAGGLALWKPQLWPWGGGGGGVCLSAVQGRGPTLPWAVLVSSQSQVSGQMELADGRPPSPTVPLSQLASVRSKGLAREPGAPSGPRVSGTRERMESVRVSRETREGAYRPGA